MPLAVIQIAEANHINENIRPRIHHLGLFENTSRSSKKVRESHNRMLLGLRRDQYPIARCQCIARHEAQMNGAVKNNEIVPCTEWGKPPPEPRSGLQNAFVEVRQLVVGRKKIESRDLGHVANNERFQLRL